MWISLGALGITATDLALSMATVEGTNPGDRNARNNNPGNLIYVGQKGATGKDSGGYAIFPDFATGLQAATDQINLDLTRGTDAVGRPTTTLAQLIASWSPGNAAGNTPAGMQSYINTVASRTGLDPNADLASALSPGSGSIMPDLTLDTGATTNPFDLSDTLAYPDMAVLAVMAGVAAWWVFVR